MTWRGRSVSLAVATGFLILGLVGLAGCDPSDDGSSSPMTSVRTTASTTGSASITSSSPQPPTAEPLVADGVWELRIDRQGGSEDSDEAFGFLPETRYHAVENGPTYHVVISERGERASVEGTRGTTQFAVVAQRASIADQQAWYELTDAFAGGRFVVWRSDSGLQGELTVYGSGRPIISSERGAFIKDAAADDWGA
jgi:hypothetical protein